MTKILQFHKKLLNYNVFPNHFLHLVLQIVLKNYFKRARSRVFEKKKVAPDIVEYLKNNSKIRFLPSRLQENLKANSQMHRKLRFGKQFMSIVHTYDKKD